VKKQIRLFALLNIFILYGFILSLYSTHFVSLNSAFSNNQLTDHESYFSLESDNLFRHSIKTENFINGFNNLPVFSLKNQFNSFLTKIKTAELFQIHVFSRQLFYSKNII